jgi:acyl-CoA synthetase (NDP forming)
VFCTYSSSSAYAIELFAGVGIPVYTSMPDCARALKALADYAAFQRRWQRDRAALVPSKHPAKPSLLASSGRVLCEADAKGILAEFGIPRIAEELVQSREAAVRAAERIGFPVALKAQSPDLLHKTEAGAVELGLDTPAAVRSAYDDIMARLPKDARRSFRGVLVQKMAASGVEAILGITRDPHLGPMLTIGLGGVLVELMNDFVVAPAPITKARALELVRALRGARIFNGVRGRPPVDIDALAELAAQLSLFAAQHESLEEVDLNPVIVHERGLSIVDALIVQRPQPDAHRKTDEPAHAHS